MQIKTLNHSAGNTFSAAAPPIPQSVSHNLLGKNFPYPASCPLDVALSLAYNRLGTKTASKKNALRPE
jgi:hypothetical protein